MRFHVLGGLVVTDGETPVDLGTPKQRAVVAVLLLERDQVVATDRLIELLWGDDNDKALVSLRAYVSRLRAILEPGRRPRDAASVLVSQAPGYRLSVPRGDVDLFRFEDQVADGRRLLRDGDHRAAAGVLDAALSTWTGPVLPELANEPFVVAAAARAGEVRLAAIESVVEAWLALGDPGEALARVEPVADRHPTRERMQGLHALALYRSGRQAEALQVVDRCRRALVEDHGLELGGELRQLESDLLSHAPVLDLVDVLPTEDASDVTERSGAAHPVEPMETSMVGRVAERAILRDALSAAEVGRGSVVVLVGEPGIGKSHLAEEAVAMAPASFATAWVRCPESRATPPFWALSHMRDQLAAQLPPGTLAPVVVPTAGRDAHAGREVALAGFGLSRSVLDQILAADHPILLVVDDLQWSDPDSLRLIEHLAADLALTRVLLVLTTRPLRDDSEDALVDCLAEISRITTTRQLEIGGLSLAEVTEWLGRRDGFGELDPVASVLHERTGGNPLFVKELTQLLDAEGRLDDPDAVSDARAIPPGVRFVVRRRVSRLPRPTQQLLSTAAVMGSPFRIDILSAVAGADDQAVLSDLAPALAEGLLVTWRADLAFSHALVGEALASEMNPARAAAIHAAMARALAEAAGPGFGTAAAEIAHHALEGILAGTGELAVEASRRAAELAARRGAEEDAAAHWGHLAFALGRVTPGDTTAIADAWIAQAESLTRADRTSAAKEPILAAVDVAAEAGNTEAMARAASLCNLTHVWTNEAYGSVDQRLLDALERTLDALGDGDPEQRAVLLGALASELVFADPERHRETCAAAESAAREAGDPTVLVRVLNNLILPNRPAQLDERRRLTNEMVDVATRHDLPDALVYAARHHVAEVHLEMGDLDAAADELVVARRVLDGMPRSHLHGQQLWAEAALANARGRFDTASELISQAHELHRKGRAYDADMVLLAARVAVAIDHGGLEDLIPFAVETAGSTTYGRVASEAVAFSMLELGRPDLARSLVEPFALGNDLPDDYTTLLGAAATVHVRIELGDVEAAEPAAALLAPYADRWSGAGISPLTMGPVSLALALHRAALGDDRADADFVESVAACETNGAVGWLARSLAHQADFLDVHGDLAGAAGARSRARDLATRHGLPYVLRRLDAVAST